MKHRLQRTAGLGAIDLIEEAIHSLRRLPSSALMAYYTGAIPFVLGLLYFLADMSRSSDARARCAPWSVVLVLLFVWMKVWQTRFAYRMRCELSSSEVSSWDRRRWLRVVRVQAALQPTRFFALLIALLVMLPFGWVFAMFENLTVLGTGEEKGLGRVFARSARQAELWPKQNHLVLVILMLFGAVVFLNVAIGLVQIPWLLKVFLGIDSVFTRSPYLVLNTTYLAVCGGLVFLCLDPLVKAIYVLRCFHGESIESGDDLRVVLRRHRRVAASVVPGLMVLGLLTLGTGAAAAESGAESPPAAAVVQRTQLDPDALDRSIGEVLERREYDWRLPRQLKPDEAGQGVVGAFAQGVVETVRSWSLAAWRWIRKVAAWIRDVAERLRERIFGPRLPPKLPGGSGVDLVTVTQVLVWVTLATVVSVLVLFGWRMWRARTPGLVVAKPGGVAVPDVADERVTADQLPEEGWLALAQELMGRGDLRLAVRALYLACLAHLARREWVRIARHKSNRDYGIELSRRAREHVDPQSAFAESIQLFDRVWYGLHEATNEHVARLQANFERIRGA